MSKKKIAALIVDRANYGRLQPVLKELSHEPEVDLRVICSGTMVLHRFGNVEAQLERDGIKIENRIYVELEGSTPVTMAKSLGIAIGEFASEFNRIRPDFLLVIGDRYEALAATLAAAYMGVTIIHLQGGEVSGSIDESARHAISKFAHYHFPATERAKSYLLRMGEAPERIFNYGCPVADVILGQTDWSLPQDVFSKGVGYPVTPDRPFLLVIFHPNTHQYGNEIYQVNQILSALEDMKMPTIWLWPNIDAGSNNISRCLREFREKRGDSWLRFMKNFSPDLYQKVLKNAACAVGNSSSFVRDSSFLGTPVVLVGNRQFGRESGKNVLYVGPKRDEIYSAIQYQLNHGPYGPNNLYGDRGASIKIANEIKKLVPIKDKYLNYIFENDSSEQTKKADTLISVKGPSVTKTGDLWGLF